LLQKAYSYLFLLTILVLFPGWSLAQVQNQVDSTIVNNDSTQLNIIPDSLSNDTLVHKPKKKSEFTSPLNYTSTDSMSYSSEDKKSYLFGEAKVNYQDIEVTADYIDYDFTSNKVFAKGVPDSVGILKGRPNFKQKEQEFTTDSMVYNFKNQRGRTFLTNTKEGDGFLISDVTKKQANGTFHIKGGKYTTCDAEHPHFYLALSKAIIIPNNKIVSGPAHFVMEDVPIYPLFIPFGFFPNKKKSTSGVIIPTYGENVTRGFYLINGGYYFALSQYMDLKLTGDIYSRGTWGLNTATNYYKRYKFGGSFDFRFKEEKTGEEGYDMTKVRYMYLNWNHHQDAKANPTQSFSASVNYSSTAYDKAFNYYNRQDLITNQKSSSISYSKSWTDMNLTAGVRHSQVSSTKDVSFTLPDVNFSVNRGYPFRKNSSSGDYKWYENISVSYSASMRNEIKAKEDDLFTRKTMDNMQNGFQHRIPINVNFKFLKFFNFTPGLNYEGRIYTTQVRKSQASYIKETQDTSYKVYYEKVDTLHQLSYAHGFTPAASLSFNPTIYGMAVFGKDSKIQAIRHVMTPTISLSMTPDIKSLVPNYFRYYNRYNERTKDTTRVKYSIYDGNIYGTPSLPVKSGSISFGINNNLEMKVKSDKDTVTGTKKIKIIETLNFSSGYNIYAESFKLSPISFSGTTALYKELRVNFNGTINPYNIDSAGRLVDRYYWKNHKGIGRLTNAGLSFGYQFQSGKGGKDKEGEKKTGNPDSEDKQPPKKVEDYAYFTIPWSLSFNYSLNYSKPAFKSQIIQSLSFNGSLSLTKKWQISFSSGYDFQLKQFAYTTFNISRNLHCWMMTIDFAPFGPYRFYSFRIAAISQLLQDLKYDTRKDFYDYNNRNY
jgi:lipopolysaccharide assembly outer membrane protein LptD (OstA)